MTATDLSRFVLPGLALQIVGQALGVSVRQYPLTLPHQGGNGVEAVRTIEQVHADLEAHGLASDDQLAPEVSDAVMLLGRAPTAIGVMSDDDQGQWAARVARDDERAVLVEQVGDNVEFTWLNPADWHVQLVGMLPSMRRAPGDTVVTTATESAESRDDVSDMALTLDNRASARTRRTTSTMREVEQVFASPRTGYGHFAITGTDRLGKPVEAPALSWVDTELGAYAMTSESGHGGNRITFTPVDNSGLAQLLRGRVESVQP